MIWEVIVLLVLTVSDILLTYNLLYKVKSMGKKDWYNNEANPIVKKFLIKYGLHKGIRFSALYVLVLMSGLLVYFKIRVQHNIFMNMVYFLLGSYVLVNMVHLGSFKYISDEVRRKNERSKNNRVR